MTTSLRRVLAAIIVTCALPIQAQRIITGRAEDAASGTALADVLAASGTSRTTTAADGRFVLRVGTSPITFARLGYAPETLAVTATTDWVVVRMRPAPLRLSATLIQGEQGFAAASSGVVRAFDLQSRPRASSQELLRLVPGLVIAQHAGGGKAEQIFLRGFDADHGTDVAISVDGMPVNLVSHGHGQGYADLHFLIPEVVERLDVRKGPYDVRDGDLGVAGSAGFVTRDRMPASVALAAGSFGQRTLTLSAPFGGDAATAGGYLAVQGTASDGPFVMPQGLRRYNAFAKFTTPWRGARLSVSASAFDARWNASGQVPERAVARGLISRFGAIDSSEGGNTARANVVAALNGGTPLTTAWEARAFASRYDFQLYSNFTFFADDSTRGDGIEQLDQRLLGGFQLSAERLRAFGGVMGSWRAAVGTRADAADVGLFSAAGRQRGATRTNDHVQVTNPYALLERTSQLGAGVRVAVGARADAFRFAATDVATGDTRVPQWD
ncbi:MAG: TonB-dependent receptor plug domain-containing protein, partial [Gemmatimonadetes bacterium]|nr:TonB-dependent receptor plug domain-containing protein [Gemmatimonadota bacterium]